MKKAILLIFFLISLKVSAQQTFWNPGVPPGSTSFSPTFRFSGTDSLANIYISNGTKWWLGYTATQQNLRFLQKKDSTANSGYTTHGYFNSHQGIKSKIYTDSLNAAIYSQSHTYTGALLFNGDIEFHGAGNVKFTGSGNLDMNGHNIGAVGNLTVNDALLGPVYSLYQNFGGELWIRSSDAVSGIVTSNNRLYTNGTGGGGSGIEYALITDIPSSGTYIQNTGVYQTGAIYNVAHGIISGTAGNGYMELLSQSASPASTSGRLRLYSDSLNRLSWKNSMYRRTIRATRSRDETFTMPYRNDPTLADSTDVANNYVNIQTASPQTGGFNLSSSGLLGAYSGIGSLDAQSAFNISSSLTGNAVMRGVRVSSVAQSNVTTSVNGFMTSLGTAASSFTLPLIVHFMASQGTFGAGSIVTTQLGFSVGSSMTGATNNRGFSGSLAASANNYNIFMSGTAQNFMAGNLGLGTASVPTAAIHLSGSRAASTWGASLGQNILLADNTITDNLTADGGTVSAATINQIGQPTINAANSSTGITYTAANTLAIKGAPIITGTNAAATNSYALNVQSGSVRVGSLTASQLVVTGSDKSLSSTLTLPNNTTATTPAISDNSTRVPTTAFVKAVGDLHGNSTTTGTATTVVTVTIGSTLANTTYAVAITPRDLLTAVNYYISAKTTTTFDVTFVTALTGSINFDYIIVQ